MFDLSGLAAPWPALLVTLGMLVAGVVYVVARRRGSRPSAHWNVPPDSLPLLSPIVFDAATTVLRQLAEVANLDVQAATSFSTQFVWEVNRLANEDVSHFGPAGGWLVVGCVVALAAYLTGRVPSPVALLALAVPLFVVGYAFLGAYNPWLGRFLLVPIAVAAPLVAYAWRWRPLAATSCAAAALTLVGVATANYRKPIADAPWEMSRERALDLSDFTGDRASTLALDRAVRGSTCVIAVLGVSDAAYVLFGPRMERDVRYESDATTARRNADLFVIGPGVDEDPIVAPGWRVMQVGRYWRVARRLEPKRPMPSDCSS